MTSETEICQLALSHIRGGSINSLDENSRQAQLCKLHYPVLRDQLLRDVPWQFAHKVKPLALLTDDLFNWIYAYQYPADCININRIMNRYESVSSSTPGSAVSSRFYDPGLPRPNLSNPIVYEIQNVDDNRVIATNEVEARIDYRAKVTNTNLFDSQFVLMLSHLLGANLAIPIIGADTGRQLRIDQMQVYQGYFDAAVVSDLNEQYHERPDSDMVLIRS